MTVWSGVYGPECDVAMIIWSGVRCCYNRMIRSAMLPWQGKTVQGGAPDGKVIGPGRHTINELKVAAS